MRLACVLVGLVLLCSPDPVSAATGVRPDLWVANGPVRTSRIQDGILYIGGSFNEVSPATGAFAVIDDAMGSTLPGFPAVTGGSVMAIASDSLGGWFLGGDFKAVGGVARSGLAHVLADGSVSPWNPNPTGGIVRTILRNGSVLYVGGSFTTLGGSQRTALVGVDVVTGVATPWSVSFTPATASVWTLTRAGSVVYVGGDFTSIATLPRNNAAAFDPNSGIFTPWSPNAFSPVHALLAHGSKIYAGGLFTTIGGQTRNHLAALDDATGAATSWNPTFGGSDVFALAGLDSTIYVGSSGFAIFDVTSGQGIPDGISGAVRAIAIGNSSVYVGGDFTIPRGRLAKLDPISNVASSWDPRPNGTVLAIAVEGSKVVVGGSFSGAGGVPRKRLAALDLSTGRATDMNPSVDDGEVTAIDVLGSNVYLAGTFFSVGGQARRNAAAVDGSTGALVGWNPNSNAEVYDLVAGSGGIFVAGRFSDIGGSSRPYIAKLDPTSAIAFPWNANPTFASFQLMRQVAKLAYSSGIVYAAGNFNGLGGAARAAIGAVNAATGVATSWNPPFIDYSVGGSPNGVRVLLPAGPNVYVGGNFTQTREDLVATDGVTGALTSFDAHLGGTGSNVQALALLPDGLHVGGAFKSVGGVPHPYHAIVDPTTGTTPGSDPFPTPSALVNTFSSIGADLYMGGEFVDLGGIPQARIAGLVQGTVQVPIPTVSTLAFALGTPFPNPVRRSSTLPFALPREADITMTVHDVSGRKIATVTSQRHFEAGMHSVTFDVGELPIGVYFLRLTAFGEQRVSRIAVFR